MNNGKPVILAVDDQPVILHTVASELKEFYQVKPVTSGQTALKYLEEQTADLILLDYQMPGMTGCEVLEKLRSNPKISDIPVVFLTGSEDGDTEVEVLEKGASDYIQKPIKAQVLLTRIRLQLELSRYRNHLEALVEEKTEHLRLANEKLKLREDMTLSLLAEVTDMRDHDTGGHIKRVTEIVRIIVHELLDNPAMGYELTHDEAENIINSAKLHDLGKIAIPDSILLKPGDLDEAEIKNVRLHTLNGAGLLEKYIAQTGDDSFLNTSKDIALCHHEKWDGTGYPQGLAGDGIPLSARITALADVYDALTAARPYKEPFPHSEAARLINNDSGTYFDPYLVLVFLKREKDFEQVIQKLT